MKSNEVDILINDLISDLKKEGFECDGYFYSNKNELIHVNHALQQVKYNQKLQTENFGLMQFDVDLHISSLLEIETSILLFLRNNAHIEFQKYIENKTKNPRQSFLDYFNKLEFIDEEKMIYNEVLFNLRRSEVLSWSDAPHHEFDEIYIKKTLGTLSVKFENKNEFQLSYYLR